MSNGDKEVDFKEYCAKCAYKDLFEDQDPCWDCLKEGSNKWTHKPRYFKENEDAENKG